MIIVRLSGGLGNQMFQYAAGRRLAYSNGAELALDITSFRRDQLREYALGPYAIKANIVEDHGIGLFQDRAITHKFMRWLNSQLQVSRRKWFVQSSLAFDPRILDLKGDIYLDGNWQNEQYFADISNIIRQEFTLGSCFDSDDADLAKHIASVQSVSVHFRRGDYVDNPHTASVHGSCSTEYYLAAIAKITKRVPNPWFFAFSDDPQWVEDNFQTDYPIAIIDRGHPDQPQEDLRLMSICKHHIIANSTFSWWGAWLSSNPEKTVVAPKRWTLSGEFDARYIIPERWNIV